MSQTVITPAEVYATADLLDQRARRVQYIVDETAALIRRMDELEYLEGDRADALSARYRGLQYAMAEWSNQFRHFAALLRSAAAAFEEADRVDGAGFVTPVAAVHLTTPRIYAADGGLFAGDAQDGALYWYGPPSNSGPNVIFINGIQSDQTSLHTNLSLIAGSSKWGDQRIAAIYNGTAGIGIVGAIQDSWQGINDQRQAAGAFRLDGRNPAVDGLIAQVRQHVAAHGEAPLQLVAHSQGAAITSAALQELKRQGVDLSRVEVTTFGGFGVSYPQGPIYHHYVFAEDPVPLAAVVSDDMQALFNPYRLATKTWASAAFFADFATPPEATVESFQHVTVIPCPDKTDFFAHDLGNYVSAVGQFEQDAAHGDWAGQLKEVVEFGLVYDNAAWMGQQAGGEIARWFRPGGSW